MKTEPKIFDCLDLPAETSHAVVCLSGGMDSTSLLMNLLSAGLDVFGISFNYGQKHSIELQRLEDLLEFLKRQGHVVSHHTVDVSVLGDLYHSALTDPTWKVPEGFYEQPNMKETVVPNRNAIFASIAYGYALSIANQRSANVAMALGVHSGDHAIYPDCRPEFYEAIYSAFSLGNWDSDRVRLYLPYLKLDKFRILQDAQRATQQLGLPFDEVFRRTHTSYEPDATGRSSGKTGADIERILAFHELGVPDPIEYVEPWEVVLKHALEVQAAHGGQPL